MELAPIILFVYNRPIHTENTLKALRENELFKDSILYVFADGPQKDANNEQCYKIDAVRSIIKSFSGCKEIKIIERSENMGLDTSIKTGVSYVLSFYHKCIVLEDDIITHPFFLRFMNESLNKYENDKRIRQIGGFNNRISIPKWYRKDVMLIPRCCSWGWGIWEDRWNDVDWGLTGYENFVSDKKQALRFCIGGTDLLTILKEQAQQNVPAWDIVWQYTLFKKQAYVLLPKNSLTYNAGCDGSGIHCGAIDMTSRSAPFPTQQFYNIKLPRRIAPCKTIIQNYKNFQDGTHSSKMVFFKWLRNYFQSLKGFFLKSIIK